MINITILVIAVFLLIINILSFLMIVIITDRVIKAHKAAEIKSIIMNERKMGE